MQTGDFMAQCRSFVKPTGELPEIDLGTKEHFPGTSDSPKDCPPCSGLAHGAHGVQGSGLLYDSPVSCAAALREVSHNTYGEGDESSTPGARRAASSLDLILSLSLPDMSTAVSCPSVWEPSIGCIGEVIGFDTETELIEEGVLVPRLVVASACSGSVCYLIPPELVHAFLECHRDTILIVHTAAFDQAVLVKHCGIDLAEWAEQGLLKDPGVLYRLVILARDGLIPKKWNLAVASNEFLGLELDKSEEIRCGFGTYLGRPIHDLPETYRSYASQDAYAHLALWKELVETAVGLAEFHGGDPEKLLGHDLQLMAELAFGSVHRHGLHLDRSAVDAACKSLFRQLEKTDAQLKREYDYYSGTGQKGRYADLAARVEKETGVEFPRTEKSSLPSESRDVLSKIDHPFCRLFVQRADLVKRRGLLVALKDKDVIHPEYNTILRTGRASSRKPSSQIIPKTHGFRELFVASPGYVLLALDYHAMELCTLAQTTQDRYGHSKMADLINQGVDLHRRFAAEMTGKCPDGVSGDERQAAKACNFGFPGGLGIPAFRAFASSSYDVVFSDEEAEAYRDRWFETFPEMQEYMHKGTRLSDQVFASLDDVPVDWPEEVVRGAALRVLSGNPLSAGKGRPYPPAFVDWVWATLQASGLHLPLTPAARAAAERRTGCDEIRRVLSTETVVLSSGRIRSFCHFPQARNTPFQGLAADGSKLALCRLIKAGFRVVNYLHDEVIVELPCYADHLMLARRIERIMIDAMREFTPGVRITVEFALMERWSKAAKPVFDDPSCPKRLLIWKPDRSIAD